MSDKIDYVNYDMHPAQGLRTPQFFAPVDRLPQDERVMMLRPHIPLQGPFHPPRPRRGRAARLLLLATTTTLLLCGALVLTRLF